MGSHNGRANINLLAANLRHTICSSNICKAKK